MSSPQYRLSVLSNSISRMNGGIFDAMRNLTIAIAAEKRYLPVVFSAQDIYTKADEPLWGDIATRTFAVRGPRIFGYAPGLANALKSGHADILHVHGIWMYPSVVALRRSRENRPYIVSPHGLLKPSALRNSRWKKRAAALLYEDEHLRRAACLHALNAAEAEAMREYGLKNPICVIPNGTTLPECRPHREPPKSRTILYLGRLHSLKGLRNLIEAWGTVRIEVADWRLVLAGWDQNHHRAELERLADQLEVRSSIDFLGPQFGDNKNRCFSSASAFILPSKSEGLPVSILEAWSRELPALMTRECNLPEGVAAGAAIMMEPVSSSIAAALRRLFALTDAERNAMGRNGRRLVEERFQWQHIGETMTGVYDWILGHGPRPDCVLV
jgi:poly(glycerol-phosphate) alpha-glucosyltransferase